MVYEEETSARRNVALPVLLGLAGLSAVSLIFIIAFAIKSHGKPAIRRTGFTQQEVTPEKHRASEQEPLPPPEEPMFLPGPMNQREWSIQEEDESPFFEDVEKARPMRRRPPSLLPKEIKPPPADDDPDPAGKAPPAEPDPILSKTDSDVLTRVNVYRKLTGLGPVSVSAELSEGCLAHAKYLAANQGEIATRGLDPHRERKDLPGYTEKGYKAGMASVIASSGGYLQGGWPSGAVNVWMATFYHRVPILNPHLKKIGIGYVLGVDRRLSHVVMDVQRGAIGPA